MSLRDQWACLVLCLAASAPARADDWLALLPACEERTAMEATFSLIYPSESLPAVVAAGDALLARVRVPAALTPPPGVQQERALSGWSAELIGAGIPLGAGSIAHRHNLPVVAIRPETGSSLWYRVRLAVPAYAAPGSYALVLRTPFGDRRVEQAVSVIAPDRLPLMAAAARDDPSNPEALAASPVDVWFDIAGAASEASLARPRLALAGRTVALRVGRELWTSAPCPRERDRFEADVLDLLRSEGRTRVEIERRVPPPSAAGEALVLEVSANRLRLDNRRASVGRRLLLLAPADRAIRARDAEFTLYPASDLSGRKPFGVAIELHVRAGADARLELGPATSGGSFVLEPELAESGADTTLRVRGGDDSPNLRVAFDYGFARSALTGRSLRARFPGPLEVPLRAFVLDPEHGGQPVRGHLTVSPRRPPTCSTALGPSQGHAAWALLSALGFLLKRRGRAAVGNRIRAARRCQLRDRPSHVQKPR